MKKLVIASAIASMISAPVFAAENVKVMDEYKTITKQIPHTEKVCSTVDVPIYGQGNVDTTGDMIIGGIIGGVIGNQIGKGGGKQAATGIGAMTGAIIGNNNAKNRNQQIVGYRQEQRCSNNTTYTTETYEVYSHSVIIFYEDGKRYALRFTK
jgi:uncharacterized protein YcfJ